MEKSNLMPITKEVGNIVVAATGSTFSTNSPSAVNNDKGYPQGDALLAALNIKSYGNLNFSSSSGGSVVANGPFKNIRSLSLDSDKLGTLINAVDGLSLARLQQLEDRTMPRSADPSSGTTGTPSFSASLRLPFFMERQGRDLDSCLDVSNQRLTLRMAHGPFTDYVTGASGTTQEVQNLAVYQHAEILQPANGYVKYEDRPLFYRTVEIKKVDITATSTGYKIELPAMDRIYRRILLRQVNNSTFAELDNAVLTDGAIIRLEDNQRTWINGIKNAALQDQNKRQFGIETWPAGLTVLDFSKTRKISEMLNTITGQNGTLTLSVDVTTGSNYSLWVVMECFKLIPDSAKRPDWLAQEKQEAAAK